MRSVWRVEFDDRTGIYHVQKGSAVFERIRDYLPCHGENGPRQITAWHDPPIRKALMKSVGASDDRDFALMYMGLRRRPPLVLGFATLEQYKRWFNLEERRQLARWPADFNNSGRIVLAEYDVPDNAVFTSPYQAAWYKDRATHIADYEPTHFDGA